MRKVIIIGSIAGTFLFAGFLLPQQKEKQDSGKDWANVCREMMDTCQKQMSQSPMMNRGMMEGQGTMGSGMMRGMGMMGRGMMGMMGGNMMGRGMMNRRDMSYNKGSETALSEPLDKQGAANLVEQYIMSLDNPRLKVGNLQDKGDFYTVEIVTKKENALVEKVKVEKKTGWLLPADNE